MLAHIEASGGRQKVNELTVRHTRPLPRALPIAEITCPNAVIPLEPETLARLLQTRAALVKSRAVIADDRWRVLYAPKLEILERDVLPRFPAELIGQAMPLMSALAPLPPIEWELSGISCLSQWV
jgi:hypothetical protein